MLPYFANEFKKITILSIRDNHVPVEKFFIKNCEVTIKYLPSKILQIGENSKKIKWETFPDILGNIEKFINSLAIRKELLRLYESEPYVHIHLMDNFGIGNIIIAGSIPVSVSVSAISYWNRKKLIYDSYLKLVYNHPNLVVVPYTKAYAEKLKKLGIPSQRIKHINWGTKINGKNLSKEEKNDIRCKLSLPLDKVIFLWSGYISSIQREDFLLAYRCARQALKEKIDAIFYFAFKSEKIAREFMHFHEPVSGIFIKATSVDEFNLLMKTADIFYSPVCKKDIILAPPLTWIEALANGMPILTTDVKGADEIVEDNKTGFIAKDEKELIDKIFQIKHAYTTMIDNCYQKAQEKYDIRNIAQNYCRLFKGAKMMYKAKKAYQDKNVAESYDRLRFKSIKGVITNWLELRLINKALQYSNIFPPAQILDIPCGTGRLSLYLAMKGYTVTGVDISSEMIRVAREKVEKYNLIDNVFLKIEDAENLSFPDDSFDAVISLRFLGHTPPEIRLKVLQEFKRVTRKHLIFVYYNRNSFNGILRKQRRKRQGLSWYPVSISEVERELKEISVKREKIFHLAYGISETMVVIAVK